MIMGNNKFPVKCKGISAAGITIKIEKSEETEPFDITLYIKKPESEDSPDPDDENSVTTTGKLTFRFGKRGLVELFAENTSPADYDAIRQEVEL